MVQLSQPFPTFPKVGLVCKQALVDSADDLLRVPWIHEWRSHGLFYRFSQDLGTLPVALMAEFEEGRRWYVVCFLNQPLPGLPTWQPRR